MFNLPTTRHQKQAQVGKQKYERMQLEGRTEKRCSSERGAWKKDDVDDVFIQQSNKEVMYDAQGHRDQVTATKCGRIFSRRY